MLNIHLSLAVPCALRDQVHPLSTREKTQEFILQHPDTVPFSFEGQALRDMHSLPFWTVNPSGPGYLICFRSSFRELTCPQPWGGAQTRWLNQRTNCHLVTMETLDCHKNHNLSQLVTPPYPGSKTNFRECQQTI